MNRIKQLLLSLSSLSLIGSPTCVYATQTSTTASAKVAATEKGKGARITASQVKEIVQKIKEAAGGNKINQATVAKAVAQVITQNPGVSVAAISSAFVQLDLKGETLKNAVQSLATVTNSTVEAVTIAIQVADLQNNGSTWRSEQALGSAQLPVVAALEVASKAADEVVADKASSNDIVAKEESNISSQNNTEVSSENNDVAISSNATEETLEFSEAIDISYLDAFHDTAGTSMFDDNIFALTLYHA